MSRFNIDDCEIIPSTIPAIKRARKSVFAKTQKICYSDKHVTNWTWLDFLQYFNDECEYRLGVRNPGIAKNAYGRWKGTIEPSIKQWGHVAFKNMIDWAIDHRHDFPQWKTFTISLVCGSHGWVQTIAQGAQKECLDEKKWEELVG